MCVQRCDGHDGSAVSWPPSDGGSSAAAWALRMLGRRAATRLGPFLLPDHTKARVGSSSIPSAMATRGKRKASFVNKVRALLLYPRECEDGSDALRRAVRLVNVGPAR